MPFRILTGRTERERALPRLLVPFLALLCVHCAAEDGPDGANPAGSEGQGVSDPVVEDSAPAPPPASSPQSDAVGQPPSGGPIAGAGAPLGPAPDRPAASGPAGPPGQASGEPSGAEMPQAGSAGGPQPSGPSGPSQTPPSENAVGSVPPPPYTLDGFMNLAPPLGQPLDMVGSDLQPPPPTGWTWYQIDGAICRDGSPTGFFVRRGSANKLLFYLEGGGACSNGPFCGFNPSNTNEVLSGDGETALGSALGAVPGRQQPGVYTGGVPGGIFDAGNDANPFRDWHQIYVPYCTGDVHFGTRSNGMVPGLAAPQQFVGHENMKKFVARIVPTFADMVDQVVLTGASAGGFGAALNYSMVQDAFGDRAHVLVVDDSGPPFDDQYMPVCMQKRWREAWGFAGSLPPDCTECQQADGGGLAKLADFMLRKHPHGRVAMISSMEDEIIRLFYSVGLVDCANYDTADPVSITLLQLDPMVFFPPERYSGGLNKLRADYRESGRLATYYMAGLTLALHQHTFRQRFFEAPAGGVSIASFVEDFLAGQAPHVGPM